MASTVPRMSEDHPGHKNAVRSGFARTRFWANNNRDPYTDQRAPRSSDSFRRIGRCPTDMIDGRAPLERQKHRPRRKGTANTTTVRCLGITQAGSWLLKSPTRQAGSAREWALSASEHFLRFFGTDHNQASPSPWQASPSESLRPADTRCAGWTF